jgi:hypothetical protein
VDGASIPFSDNKVDCDVMVGYKAVYRMCFAMACFFFLFSIIMIRVRSSKDPRASIQNGYGYVAVRMVYLGESGATWWWGPGYAHPLCTHELFLSLNKESATFSTCSASLIFSR